MSTTYERSGPDVGKIAANLMATVEIHKPLKEAGVKIDFLTARAERDEDNEPVGSALTKNGHTVLGIARKTNLKERAADRGDAEIIVDGDWWEDASEEEQRALLDHEMTHLSVKQTPQGLVKTDDLGRPVIIIRHHDYEVGWFRDVAQRNGKASLECRYAASIMERDGQYFWPAIEASANIETARFTHINAEMAQTKKG